jgi:hypothetical protein
MFGRTIQAGQGGFEGTKDLPGNSSTPQSRPTVSHTLAASADTADQ